MDKQPPRISTLNQQFDPREKPMDNSNLANARPASDADLSPSKYYQKRSPHCRLYLQVTTLAKITDHKGIKILEEVLHSGQRIPSLKQISQSLFQWPTQPNPGQSAWKLWTRTLQTLYTKPGMTTQLKQPLGQWYPSTVEVRKWHISYNPPTQEIFSSIPGQQPQKFSPHHTTRTHIYYQQATPNQLLHTTYPITIDHQCKGSRIALPILPIPTRIQQNPEPPSHAGIKNPEVTTNICPRTLESF